MTTQAIRQTEEQEIGALGTPEFFPGCWICGEYFTEADLSELIWDYEHEQAVHPACSLKQIDDQDQGENLY